MPVACRRFTYQNIYSFTHTQFIITLLISLTITNGQTRNGANDISKSLYITQHSLIHTKTHSNFWLINTYSKPKVVLIPIFQSLYITHHPLTHTRLIVIFDSLTLTHHKTHTHHQTLSRSNYHLPQHLLTKTHLTKFKVIFWLIHTYS